MANAGVKHGGDVLLYKNTGTDVAPVWVAFAHSTSHSLKFSRAAREISSKDTGDSTQSKPGKLAAVTISMSGLATYDDTNIDDLVAGILDKTLYKVKYSGRPAADPNVIESVEAAGDKYYSGTAFLTEVSEEDPHDGNATFSASFQFTAKPTVSTVAA